MPDHVAFDSLLAAAAAAGEAARLHLLACGLLFHLLPALGFNLL